MKEKIIKIWSIFLDLIFPKACLACQKEGFLVCPDCFKKIAIIKKQTCPVCGQKESHGRVCPACADKTSLDSLICICRYQDEIVQKAIHALKYQYASSLKEFFYKLFSEYFQKYHFFDDKKYVIIPVPLHKKKQRQRGFNQSELLATELAKILKIKLIADNLTRVKHTESQMTLPGKARENNVKDAFAIKNPLEISGQSVILIDDVYTTGSTMNEAAKVLKKSKARQVNGFVIARD
jgi:ComF family protein